MDNNNITPNGEEVNDSASEASTGANAPELTQDQILVLLGTNPHEADLSALERLPDSALERLPGYALARLPGSALERLPDSALARLPGYALERLPDSALARLPGYALERLPDSALERLPGYALARLPDSALARLPDSALARLPDSALERLPDSALERLPDSALARLEKVKKAIEASPVVPNLYTSILRATESQGCGLDMSSWECGSTRCVAGWTVHLAGAAGRALKEEWGWQSAATIIHKKSRPGAPLPNYAGSVPNEAAMAYVRARASEEPPMSQRED